MYVTKYRSIYDTLQISQQWTGNVTIDFQSFANLFLVSPVDFSAIRGERVHNLDLFLQKLLPTPSSRLMLRSRELCFYCHIRSGFLVKCRAPSCNFSFHPICFCEFFPDISLHSAVSDDLFACRIHHASNADTQDTATKKSLRLVKYHQPHHPKKRKLKESETILSVSASAKKESRVDGKQQAVVSGMGESEPKNGKKTAGEEEKEEEGRGQKIGEEENMKNEKEGVLMEAKNEGSVVVTKEKATNEMKTEVVNQEEKKMEIEKESKASKELKESNEVKEVKESKESKEHKESKEPKEVKELKESKESKESTVKDQPTIVDFFHSSNHTSSHPQDNTSIQPELPSSISEPRDASSIPEVDKRMEVEAPIELSEKTQTEGPGETEEEEEEEGETCNICGYGYSEPDDQLVFCDHCNLAVHQSCYGIATLPEGDWMCSVCSHGRAPSSTYCYICNKPDGAMHCTEDGIFVHLICVFYTPELSLNFTGPEVLVEGINRISRERAQLVCSICGVKGGGCVQCSSRHCSIAYHPYCAQQAGYLLTSDEKGGQFMYLSYCKSHTQKKNDRKPKMNGGNTTTSKKKRRGPNRKRRAKEQEPTGSIPKEILDK